MKKLFVATRKTWMVFEFLEIHKPIIVSQIYYFIILSHGKRIK